MSDSDSYVYAVVYCDYNGPDIGSAVAYPTYEQAEAEAKRRNELHVVDWNYVYEIRYEA